MPPVKIVHISDLHISEHLLRGSNKNAYLPHRYGHDVQAFLALDSFLKSHEWDMLLITGDVSRIGNKESFEWVRNWLENEILFGATKVGLNLSKSNTRQYLIIPGNHDRFNGKLKQGGLDLYHQEFPVVRSGSIKSLIVHDQKINVHFFDSTTADGGFAYGEIDQSSLTPKTLLDEDIDIALLHHHFLQPPKHPREISTELTNSSEVAAYMLNTGFDGIFFGHTHKGYIGRLSVEVNFYKKTPHWNLDHYFRNLYQIVKYVHNAELKDKKFYTNIIRAQLSNDELILLFFNALSEFGREKFRPLIVAYQLLEHLPLLSEIEPTDALRFGRDAFGDSPQWKTFLATVPQ